MKKITIKRIAFVAVFAAISVVLYNYVKFNLPIFPSFLDVNFSMIPIIICAFMLGPWDATIIVVIRFLMKLLLVGSGTQYVGEIADLIIGIIPCISAGLIYKYYKGRFKELLSFSSVVLLWVITSIIINVFVNVPFYVEWFFKGDWNILVSICRDAFNLITFGNAGDVNKGNFMVYYVFLAVIPFNLMLSLVVVGITVLVHKRLKTLYDII